MRRGQSSYWCLIKESERALHFQMTETYRLNLEKNLLNHVAKNSGVCLALDMNGFIGSNDVTIRTQSFTFLTEIKALFLIWCRFYPLGGKIVAISSRLTSSSSAISAEEHLLSSNSEEVPRLSPFEPMWLFDHSHIGQGDEIDWPPLKMYVLLQW